MGTEAAHRGGRGRADLGQTDNCSFFGQVLGFYCDKHNVCTRCLLIFLAMQPGIRLGDSDGQLGCPFLKGSPVLGGDIVSSLGTGRFVAH